MNYVGDFNVGQIVQIYFNTFSSNDPSASVTMTDFVTGDARVYKDDSLTQRASTTGQTVDVDIDSDPLTGVHKITIDTSDNSTADFYEAGHDYAVVIVGVTVDAGTLNSVVGTFSIANRRIAGEMARSSIEAYTSNTAFTLTTGEASGDNDAYNGCIIIITDQTTKIQKSVGTIADYVGSTRGVTLSIDPGQFTFAVGDSVEIIAATPPTVGLSASTIVVGNVTTSTSTTSFADSAQTEATDDHFNGRIVIFTSGVLKNQASDITDYTGSSKTFTVTAMTEAPGASVSFVIV